MASLRGVMAGSAAQASAALFGPDQTVQLKGLTECTGLASSARAALAGASVLIRTRTQIAAAQALVELDGLARRLVLCPPDLAAEHLPAAAATAEVEAVVTDLETPELLALGLPVYRLRPPTDVLPTASAPEWATQWLMFTSGTTGAPKMVIRTLEGLTGAIKAPASGAAVVWGTFYDIRRYGGLQMLLRALTGGVSMVLTDAHEPMPAFLERLATHGVTHLSGTPSHWRRALMTPQTRLVSPGYVRLSGEIADQAVLDSLAAFFPTAAIGHAYASTEAGVGFEVNDGREGFPAAYVGTEGPVEMRVVDGALQLRSARAALGYAGGGALIGGDGFVDTGDMVELRGDRYHFVGRRGGVINVGGLKVHPEEVEAVINRHPAVRMSRVSARKSPITGALVTAEVVRSDAPAWSALDEAAVKSSILTVCRETLAAHKAPAVLRFVPSLAVTAGGKLERAHA